MTRTCSHPACRTSLDEFPVECPHGKPFCGDCVFEDGCDLCDFDAAKSCTHAGFFALDNPRRPMTECPDCKAVLRSTTDRQGWIDHAAERRAEDRAYEDARLRDREEERRAG